MTGTEVIRIEFPRSASDEFKQDVLDAVTAAIRIIEQQYHEGKADAGEVEVAMGKLYFVRGKVEK